MKYLFLLLLLGLAPVRAADAPKELVFREGVVVGSVGRGGRASVPTDAVAALLVAGKWQTPNAGDKVVLPDGGERLWEAAKAGDDGWLTHRALRGGYVSWRVPCDADRVFVLEAAGHTSVLVNGEPRGGDVYALGYVRLPVALRKGDNELLFQVARGRLRARLVEPKAPVSLDLADVTAPDLLVGAAVDTKAALLVTNATGATLSGLTLRAALGSSAVETPLPSLPPYSIRKVGFALRGSAPDAPGDKDAELMLLRGGTEADRARLTLRVRRPGDTYKVTFESSLDGSVQYYAINPARPVGPSDAKPALFLTLHGASVEALGQAAAYAPKTWGHLVAPTNRRPYGFDWEDWGRLDALEVLEHAKKRLGTDPSRTYLTGHSMGGHGSWHLGVTFPDRFAAVGPSAGWVSMWSYAGAAAANSKDDPLQALLTRAMSPSDTLALARNLAPCGVYVLHGDADDNVPVREARRMKESLEKFHRDFSYHEQRGAGHWWDASDEPGTDCVDWAPLFDAFARRVLPERSAVRFVDFTTASPGVSPSCHWATVEAQTRSFLPSRVVLRCDSGARRFAGTTENVLRLALDVRHLVAGAPLTVEVDGQKIEKLAWPEKGTLWLRRDGDRWSATAEPAAALKGPRRSGPFKDAFRNRMIFVHGTRGSAEENAWSLARARFDAETFWYRGNGSVDIVADTAFDANKERDRNVILYGNADTNAAWAALLGESPVQARRGVARVGEREEKGDDLACLVVRPRPGSDVACVAAIAGTGIVGLRASDRLPVFTSGVAYPDCLVIGIESLTKGVDGVRCAGFFGEDWSVAKGEFAWRK